MRQFFEFFKNFEGAGAGLILIGALVAVVVLAYFTGKKCRHCNSRHTHAVVKYGVEAVECSICGAIIAADGKVFRSARKKVESIDEYRDRAAS